MFSDRPPLQSTGLSHKNTSTAQVYIPYVGVLLQNIMGLLGTPLTTRSSPRVSNLTQKVGPGSQQREGVRLTHN